MQIMYASDGSFKGFKSNEEIIKTDLKNLLEAKCLVSEREQISAARETLNSLLVLLRI